MSGCPTPRPTSSLIPDGISDEQCLLLADIASTGISAAERADVAIGETVAVFAQGPIGLCATAGARLMGAALVMAVDHIILAGAASAASRATSIAVVARTARTTLPGDVCL